MVLLLLLALTAPPAQSHCTRNSRRSRQDHTPPSGLPWWPKRESGKWGGGDWLGWTWNSSAIQTSRVMNDALQPDHPLTISIGFRHYELRLQSARDDLADARVVLSDTSRTQVLYSADGFSDDPHYVVEWAGDLDGDGKLDLVVDLHRKYSVHPHRLLLSTKAAGDQLVGEAAVFETLD
jgi:hypothetical protein